VFIGLVFADMGVIGTTVLFLSRAEVSDIGGDGGLVWSVEVSDFGGGGVDIDGEEVVVIVVEASDIGETGRTAPVTTGLGLLLLRKRCITASACDNFSCVISASTLRSDKSSLKR